MAPVPSLCPFPSYEKYFEDGRGELRLPITKPPLIIPTWLKRDRALASSGKETASRAKIPQISSPPVGTQGTPRMGHHGLRQSDGLHPPRHRSLRAPTQHPAPLYHLACSSLTCEVHYEMNCDIVSLTNWWYIKPNPNEPESKPITDPNQYLITVKETEKEQFRNRNIFLSFNSVSLEDSGYYQCDAKCLNSGTQAKGHLLYLNVTADPNKDLKASTWSGQLKADEAVLALSAILFLSRY
ncbi:unnamed protein product [Leuciscus chuanchicus]